MGFMPIAKNDYFSYRFGDQESDHHMGPQTQRTDLKPGRDCSIIWLPYAVILTLGP